MCPRLTPPQLRFLAVVALHAGASAVFSPFGVNNLLVTSGTNSGSNQALTFTEYSSTIAGAAGVGQSQSNSGCTTTPADSTQ